MGNGTATRNAETEGADFERLIELAYESLPMEIREFHDFPAILIEDEVPSNIDPTALGHFRGLPRIFKLHNVIAGCPNEIRIFKGPIMRKGGDIAGTVRRMLWHEVAHYLGFDEDAVKSMGL